MSQIEGKLKSRLLKRFASEGGIYYNAVASAYSSAGWPDTWICGPDWAGWVEFKSVDGRLRLLQQTVITKMLAHGAKVLVCRLPFTIENHLGRPLTTIEKDERFDQALKRAWDIQQEERGRRG